MGKSKSEAEVWAGEGANCVASTVVIMLCCEGMDKGKDHGRVEQELEKGGAKGMAHSHNTMAMSSPLHCRVREGHGQVQARVEASARVRQGADESEDTGKDEGKARQSQLCFLAPRSSVTLSSLLPSLKTLSPIHPSPSS